VDLVRSDLIAGWGRIMVPLLRNFTFCFLRLDANRDTRRYQPVRLSRRTAEMRRPASGLSLKTPPGAMVIAVSSWEE
jgi:hypothetical protein